MWTADSSAVRRSAKDLACTVSKSQNILRRFNQTIVKALYIPSLYWTAERRTSIIVLYHPLLPVCRNELGMRNK